MKHLGFELRNPMNRKLAEGSMQGYSLQTRDWEAEVPGEVTNEGPCQEWRTTWLCPQVPPYPLPQPFLSVGRSPFAPAELFAQAEQVPSAGLPTAHQTAPGPGNTILQDPAPLPQNPCPQT